MSSSQIWDWSYSVTQCSYHNILIFKVAALLVINVQFVWHTGQRTNVHQLTKFQRNWSNIFWYIAIYSIFAKRMPSAVLGLKNCLILLTDIVWSQHVLTCKILIFTTIDHSLAEKSRFYHFFNMAVFCHLVFLNLDFLVRRGKTWEGRHLENTQLLNFTVCLIGYAGQLTSLC